MLKEEYDLGRACARLNSHWIWERWFRTKAYRNARWWAYQALLDLRDKYVKLHLVEDHKASMYRKMVYAESLLKQTKKRKT